MILELVEIHGELRVHNAHDRHPDGGEQGANVWLVSGVEDGMALEGCVVAWWVSVMASLPFVHLPRDVTLEDINSFTLLYKKGCDPEM